MEKIIKGLIKLAEDNSTKLQIDIEGWLQKAKAGVENNSQKEWPNTPANHTTLTWIKGPKYTKVISEYLNGSSRSAYMFIDNSTGDIYKASSWKAPAKGIRGNINTVDLSKLSSSTMWLYKRY